jgi:hypothetical protein
MLGDMTRASLLVVVCALAQPAVGAPRQAGKVVRVERTRATSAIPRICDVQPDKTGNCFGPEPSLGDIITLVDESGIVGEVRIIEITAFALNGRPNNPTKGCDGLWSVRTDLLRGDLSNSIARTVGVIDPGMHPRRGRMIPKDQLGPPSGRGDDNPQLGFDRDGDRVADIVLTQTQCDGSGSMCIEEWVRTKGEMKRVHQVNFQNCGI